MVSISEIVNQQEVFFNTNTTKSVSFRKKQLQKLKSVLKSGEQDIYKAIYKDFKKSEFETYAAELSLIYHEIDLAIKKLNQWSRKKKVSTNLVNFPASSYIIPEPLGICTVIGAWNYPIQLSLAPVIGALAAGNTVILKPSELPQQTSNVLAQIINKAFPKEYLFVFEGGVDETTKLLEQKVDKIFFTGSAKIGKIVYKAAAEKLIPVTLELGGKSPAIITESCNLKMTVKRLVWAKFLNAGQTCIAPDYVVIHESIHEKFISLCKAEIKNANYRIENQNYVQIINQKNFERLGDLLDGISIAIGGKCIEEERIIEPTVITDVSFSDKIMEEEIFGPILPVIQYKNFENIISKIKEIPKPLSCYIFSENKSEMQKLLNQLSFGGGAINDAIMHITNSNLPFGGVGFSGFGKYHGKYSFDNFSNYKGFISKPTWFEIPLKFSPLTASKLKWIKWLMKF